MASSEMWQAVYVFFPAAIAFLLSPILFMTGYLPFSLFGYFIGGVLGVGYGGVGFKYLQIRDEATAHPTIIGLFREERNMRWANYCIAKRITPLGVKEVLTHLKTTLPSAPQVLETTGTGTRQVVGQLDTVIARKVYVYLIEWLYLSVLPFMICLSPAPLDVAGMMQDVSGVKHGGMFDFHRTEILYKSFFVPSMATNATFTYMWFIRDELTFGDYPLPIYQITDSDYHNEMAQQGVLLPPFGRDAVQAGVDLYYQKKSISQQMEIDSLRAHAEGYREKKDAMQSIIDEDMTQEELDLLNSRKHAKRPVIRGIKKWEIALFAAVVLGIAGVMWYAGVFSALFH